MRLILFSFLLLQTGMRSWAQDMSFLFVEKDVMGVMQNTMQDANALMDIHPGYKAAWVASYIATEITLVENGTSTTATGVDGNINAAQKSLLKNAAAGSKVIVRVKYMPDNTLKHNTEQEMDYTYVVIPAVLAEFPGGTAARNAYIDQHIIAKLDAEQKNQLKIAKFTFSVAADGSIAEVQTLEGSGNGQLDAILVQGIREMPKWKPAQKSDGTFVAQSMKFFISNSKGNCLMY
jgi:hypothetical protein